MATLSEQLALAVQHHKAGRLQVAEQIYRQVLAHDPKQPEALHLLGLIAHQVGRHESAIELIESALRLDPTMPVFHSNLGEAYRALRRLPEAATCFQRALALQPNYALAHNNLGLVFYDQGQVAEAMSCFRNALQFRPNFADAHNNLGNALLSQGQPADAIACYRRALQLSPDFAGAHNNLGLALHGQGQHDEAIACFEQALRLKPDFAEAHNNLGNTLQKMRRHPEAIAAHQRALRLKPDYVEAYLSLGNALMNYGQTDDASACYRQVLKLDPLFAGAHNNLGTALKDQARLSEAAACYRQALQIAPDYFEAYSNLGSTLKDQGCHAEAGACFRKALAINPDFVKAHSNLVYLLHFCPDQDARAIYEEHGRWNQRHAAPLARFIQPHANDPAPGRRLRIGYVSPNFHDHVVTWFLLSLLQAHDHADFEIFCYASVANPDATTEKCRACADVWRNVFGMSDEQLAQTIRADQIDILVDLTMHMVGSRLLAFARKPAPVQVTYLAYCSTTGLETMDYRFTDRYLDPPSREEEDRRQKAERRRNAVDQEARCYSEESIHLPETYWCYQPPIEAPEPNFLPALQAGHITFACLNNFCKVTEPTLEAWCRILEALPEAQLLLHAHAGDHRERVRNELAKRGIAPERLTFQDQVRIAEYFRTYERIDVALDPFPYGGGTTTCDALWMGVPVVTLAGQTAVGRGGVSILSNVGLAELVAHDTDQYVRIAVDLAGDLTRLSQLRATLRERMRGSPLMDAPRFARAVEAAYREMWQHWCEKK